jgi:hypothetical protein
MAKKKSVLPPTMCDVTDCMRDAIYGFRQIVDTTTSDGSSKVKTFAQGISPSWCEAHNAEQHPLYLHLEGRYIKLQKV